MSTQRVRNALSERDYWIAAPVGIMWLLWAYRLIGSSHRLDWIGGAVALCLGSVILGLAVFYHAWARWVITVWYVGLLANWAIESYVGGAATVTALRCTEHCHEKYPPGPCPERHWTIDELRRSYPCRPMPEPWPDPYIPWPTPPRQF